MKRPRGGAIRPFFVGGFRRGLGELRLERETRHAVALPAPMGGLETAPLVDGLPVLPVLRVISFRGMSFVFVDDKPFREFG